MINIEEVDKVEEELAVNSITRHVVETENCGEMDVYVEGDLDKLRDTSTVFLTVHDVGSSYLSWVQFTQHKEVREVRNRSVFLHLSVCGQAPDNQELESFPSMQDLSMDLVTVLDQLKIQTVVAMGDGAGANIVMQFAMSHPGRVWGVVLINCSATEGPDAVDRGTLLTSPRLLVGINKLHKDKMTKKNSSSKNEVNFKNLSLFESAYRARADLTSQLAEKISFDTLLITGTKSKTMKDTEEIHKEVKPGTCSIIKIDDVKDVMTDATDKLVDAIILFCQGLGLMPSARRRTSRSWSVSSQPKTFERGKSMEHLAEPSVNIISRIKSISLTVPAPLAPRPSILARFAVD